MDQVEEVRVAENMPQRTTYDPIIYYTDSANLKNKLIAGKIDTYSNDSNFSHISDGLRLEFYNESGKQTGVLTASEGFIYGQRGLMEARDSVRFVNEQNEKLITERLIWNQDSGIVYTKSPVTIEREDGVIYGKGLVSNESFSKYRITEPSGVLYIDEESEPR